MEWFSARVVRKHEEAAGIFFFELVDPDGKELPPFTAGSHLEIRIGDKIRQYSLCNPPSERHRYIIAVQRELAGRGGSQQFCDAVKEGDTIVLRGPHNLFPLNDQAGTSILLAGGIGVTPILAMAEHLQAGGANFQFHYCTRTRARTAFYDRIAGSSFAPSTQFHFDDGPEEQRPHFEAFLGQPAADKHVYICGPAPMIDAVVEAAKRLAWPDDHVHVERFVGAAAMPGDARDFYVEIKRTGQIVLVPHDKTVVQALAEIGVDIPVSCEQGVCATCLTNIVEGVPDHRDLILTRDEQASNKLFTPCVSRAKSDILVLDL